MRLASTLRSLIALCLWIWPLVATSQQWEPRFQWFNTVASRATFQDSTGASFIGLQETQTGYTRFYRVNDLSNDLTGLAVDLPLDAVLATLDADGDAIPDVIGVTDGRFIVVMTNPADPLRRRQTTIMDINQSDFSRDGRNLIADIDGDGSDDLVMFRSRRIGSPPVPDTVEIAFGSATDPLTSRSRVALPTWATSMTRPQWAAVMIGDTLRMIELGPILQDGDTAYSFRYRLYTANQEAISAREPVIELLPGSQEFIATSTPFIGLLFEGSLACYIPVSSSSLIRIAPSGIGVVSSSTPLLSVGYPNIIGQSQTPNFLLRRIMLDSIVASYACTQSTNERAEFELGRVYLKEQGPFDVTTLRSIRLHDLRRCPFLDASGFTSGGVSVLVLIPDQDGDRQPEILVSYAPTAGAQQHVTDLYFTTDQAAVSVPESKPAPTPLQAALPPLSTLPVYNALGQLVGYCRTDERSVASPDDLSDLPQMPLWAVSDGCAVRIR